MIMLLQKKRNGIVSYDTVPSDFYPYQRYGLFVFLFVDCFDLFA